MDRPTENPPGRPRILTDKLLQLARFLAAEYGLTSRQVAEYLARRQAVAVSPRTIRRRL